jgi:MFS family permease
MNIGMFIPIMLGGILMRKWGLQKPLVIAAALTVLISAILFVSPTLTMFSFAVAGIGACGGIFMTIGSYLVVRINPDEKSRSSSLIFTDFFFSLAGATLSFLLAWLFRMGASWIAMYGIMGGLFALSLPDNRSTCAATAQHGCHPRTLGAVDLLDLFCPLRLPAGGAYLHYVDAGLPTVPLPYPAARSGALYHRVLGREGNWSVPQSVHREVDEVTHLPAGLYLHRAGRHCADCQQRQYHAYSGGLRSLWLL